MMKNYSIVDFDVEWTTNMENLFPDGDVGDDVQPSNLMTTRVEKILIWRGKEK